MKRGFRWVICALVFAATLINYMDRQVLGLLKPNLTKTFGWDDLDYANMPGLSREIVEKLTRIRPHSIAQASRIPGITPAAISILLFQLEMRRNQPSEKVV